MVSTTIFRLRFNRNYTTFVKTSHGHVRVDFTPIVLLGRTENSQFGTADPEVVEALKKHRDFGSLFFIEEEGKSAPAEKKAKAAKKAEAGSAPVETDANTDAETNAAEGAADADAGTGPEADKEDAGSDETEAEAADNLTHEKTVTSKNKAIAYLLEKHGATFAQTADIAAMQEEVRSVYNLVFDNWK